MSGMATYTPGMEMSGGSLGLGLSIAVGMCLGLKRKGSDSRVYTLFSDGELDEGSKWEAMMSAAHYKLDNLIAIVDVNNQQADGPSKQMMGFEPLADKMRAFGWFVQRVDGNDLDAVVAAFDAAKPTTDAKPRMIIADTLMGKGVPFLEAARAQPFHARRPARVAACAASARRRTAAMKATTKTVNTPTVASPVSPRRP